MHALVYLWFKYRWGLNIHSIDYVDSSQTVIYSTRALQTLPIISVLIAAELYLHHI